jgi:predicted DNA-binding ribbon-helix-helix protein
MGPKHPRGKSLVIKRSVYFGELKTSVTLEDPFWVSLSTLAKRFGVAVMTVRKAVDPFDGSAAVAA